MRFAPLKSVEVALSKKGYICNCVLLVNVHLADYKADVVVGVVVDAALCFYATLRVTLFILLCAIHKVRQSGLIDYTHTHRHTPTPFRWMVLLFCGFPSTKCLATVLTT